jgi:tetratricopeptide (TPR) repeat protein
MRKSQTILILVYLSTISLCTYSQNRHIPQITLANSIEYSDTSFTDLPGNGFLIDVGDEILAVTCKHVFWENRQKEMKTISFDGKLKTWRMVVINDPSQYVVLGELINENSNELISERNTDRDYLVFKIKENHSKITPLKLSTRAVQAGDTIYKVGWSFKTKISVAEPRTATAYKYLGSSLLITNLVQENGAGLSGSPVINQNNELVGIISSWRFDSSTGSWFEAPCSTDYLWEVLYNYWLTKNAKTKSIGSFQEYLTNFSAINGAKPEASANLYTNLFFPDWLKAHGYKYGSVENYASWTAESKQTNGVEITMDSYRKSLLIFDSWKNDYLAGSLNFKDLEQKLTEAKISLPCYLDFCEFSQELSAMGQHDKAIAILLSADEKIQHMGQLYAYLGEAYRAKGEKELAKAAYLKCFETYPNYPMAKDGMSKLK